jgi:xylulokinase
MNAGCRAERLLLGLDIGTTRIKAIAIDADGVEQVSASVPTPFAASAAGVDMEVADLGRALAAAVAALGPARRQVAAVGIAGLAESGAPLRAGRPLAPIIAWHDGRGEETVASLERRFGPALGRWTGRRVRTVSSVAKLGWLVDHGLPEPDRWLGVPELALFLLTGTEATEHSLAARTGAYHVTERRFLPDVIAHVLRHDGRSTPGHGAEAAGADLFPPVLAAGEIMGLVTDDGAATYGLPAGIPVTISGHDHLAAAAGLGAQPDDLLNSVGTAETVVRRLDAAPNVEQALELDLAVTVWPGGDAWAVLASALRSGLLIDALTDHLGMQPDALDAALEATGRAAQAWAPGTADAPAAARTGAAAGGRGRELVALGQGIEVVDGPPGDMWAETLRALSRRTAAAAERVATLAGPHRRLVVFGGGSRSPAWLRSKAAELGIPVVGCSVPEAAARGAALAAGAALGWWPGPAAGPPPPLDASGAAPGAGQPKVGPVPAIDVGGGPAGTMDH